MRLCSFAGCEKRHKSHGYCPAHLRRWKLYGDAAVLKQPQIHGQSTADRFNAYVMRGAGCWEWQGAKDYNGYGRLNVNAVPELAHRLSWKLLCHDITPDQHVCHRCDNPGCVRPEHLFLGDQVANNADKMAKKRHRFGVSRGEDHGQAKLSAEQVRAIRGASGVSRVVGEAFGISGRQVREIRSRTAWRHIE